MLNPQIENLEKVAAILSKIPEQFVFTGGAMIALYLDEILWDEVRPTIDVDCVVEIASRVEYYALADRLRALALKRAELLLRILKQLDCPKEKATLFGSCQASQLRDKQRPTKDDSKQTEHHTLGLEI